jgi:hypothetical protein
MLKKYFSIIIFDFSIGMRGGRMMSNGRKDRGFLG